MKRILCILLMLLFCLPALAEENPHAPFTLTAPESVARVDNEGSVTYVYGTSRVVVIRIERVPDADPADALVRMLAQFDPDAVIGDALSMAEGYTGLTALTAAKFGEDVNAYTVMLLAPDGTLLIFTGYDMAGSDNHIQALMDTLLSGISASGAPIVLRTE